MRGALALAVRRVPLVAVAGIWATMALPGAGVAAATGPFDAPGPGGDPQAAVPIPPPGDRYFGFHETSFGWGLNGWSDRDIAAVARGAGANSERLDVYWWAVEPQRDRWDPAAWAHYRRIYRALISRGIRPVLTVGFAPTWARDRGLPRLCTATKGCEYPPASGMLGQWARFVGAVARRFPRAAAIEIWNEPNTEAFWKPFPDPARYAALVASAHRAVKRVNPRIPVIAGSLAPTQKVRRGVTGRITDWPMRSFLEAAYAARPSIKNRIDGISFHNDYQSLDYGAGSLLAKAFDDVRSVSRRNGDAGIPLWITEDGLTTSGPAAFTQEEQASGLLRQYRRVMTMPDVRGFIIHTLIDRYEVPAGDVDRGFGTILSWDPFVPKLSYCAFAGRVDRPTPYGGCPKKRTP